MTTTDPDQQTDHGWDNRRLILASLAPRTTTRPARRTPHDTNTEPDTTEPPKKPSLALRAARATSRTAAAGARRINNRIPPNRRIHTAILTVVALLALLTGLAGVSYLSGDVAPQSAPTSQSPPPPAPSLPPINRTVVLAGVTASDICPRDANYSEAARAFDGDINTAWTCTRAKNSDGQTIQVDFGRQVILEQIRAIGGFDATISGTDQWPLHHIVTAYEIYFPKELNRPPAVLTTNGVRDWRPVNIEPPATVSKVLIRVAETSEPPQSPNPTTEPAQPGAEEVTTVATSEIQFVGTDSHPS